MRADSVPRQGVLHSLDLRLPPLPHTLPEVLALVNGPAAPDAKAVAEVVQYDPVVSARLLRQINSSYYGLRRSVSSVERAVRMMGPTSAAGNVIGLGMLEMKELANEPAQSCFTHLIQHSIGTAFLSRFLLKRLPAGAEETREEARASDGFTEGLLHDLGKMVLAYNYPEKAVALYEKQSVQQRVVEKDERVLEQLVFGCDHTEAGAYAASKLCFPEELVDVIRRHHTPAPLPGGRQSDARLRAVCAANLATKAMGERFRGSRLRKKRPDWETCADDPVWAHWQGASSDTSREHPPQLMRELRAKKEDLTLSVRRFTEPTRT